MSAREQVARILDNCGAILVRAKKHQVWLLPTGKSLIRSSTPRGSRGDKADLSRLRKELDLPISKEGTKPSRAKLLRAKRPTAQSSTARMKGSVASLSMAESLRMAGVTDDSVRDRLSTLESRVNSLETELKAFKEIRFYKLWLWLRDRHEQV